VSEDGSWVEGRVLKKNLCVTAKVWQQKFGKTKMQMQKRSVQKHRLTPDPN